MNRRAISLVAGAAALVLIAGGVASWFALGPRGEPEARQGKAASSQRTLDGVVQDESGRRILYWYDPMVPGQRFQKPGKSPFMDMQLVPKYADEAEGGVKIAPDMVQSLGLRLGEAKVRSLAPAVQAVGRIEIDERRIVEVQTLTPGYIEQLAVRAVGEPVQADARVASVYSPDLLEAQLEYAALLKMSGEAVSPGLREATRRRLTLLGLPEGQIRLLERGGQPQRTYGVFTPTAGIVTAIAARPGARVETGQSIVTIADLSRVWAVAEIPETALGAVAIGQPAEIAFPAYPGETRHGKIDYIYPTLDPEARTVRVRVTLPNPGLRLKAGMFANMTITGTGGASLVVPSEAVIATGRRNLVIVKRETGFVPVEVRLGRETGEQTEILAGLRAGEQVVLSGQFLIDSEASLSGVLERLRQTGPDQAEPGQQARSPAATLVQAEGIIQSIDPAQRRVTIAHGPVPALGWPAMTMTFSVENAATIEGLARGDRVRFAFRQAPDTDGVYKIERISRGSGR